MPKLPPRANLDHLRKQAKDLLRAFDAGEQPAAARIAAALPGASRAEAMRLHHAQSCIAREYGFPSWRDLVAATEAQALDALDPSGRRRSWLDLAYAGDLTGTLYPARPHAAARALDRHPDLLSDPAIACAAGHLDAVRRGAGWANRPLGALALPPLIAATHSSLARLSEFRDRLLAAIRDLLEAGADPNIVVFNRAPPASLAEPDRVHPLSALYGAAGVIRDHEMTALLLAAGADPNDNESLYHSLEDPAITRLLLDAGARIAGTNALRRSLDMPAPAALELLLARGADPNEAPGPGPTRPWGAPLLRALALRKPLPFIDALLGAGADPSARTAAGVSAYCLALRVGLTDAAQRLRAAGAPTEVSEADEFVAACARGDTAAAERIKRRRPDLPTALPPDTLRLLPDSVAWSSDKAVRTMVVLGWPLAARGGDWDATALNHAVFRGAADLTRLLLEHGADWHEPHGYGDDVLGTLSWASIHEPTETGDWPACARALREHGLPAGRPDPSDPTRLLIAGRAARFSPEVHAVLLTDSEHRAQTR